MKKLALFVAFAMLFSLCISCGPDNVQKAQELIDLKMYDQAIELLRSEITNNPKKAAAHLKLGIAYLYSGNEGLAVESFERALSLEKSYASEVGEVYAVLGKKNLDEKKFYEAVKYLENAISWYEKDNKSQEHLDLYYFLGVVYYKMEGYANAIDRLTFILKSEPKHMGAHTYLVYCYDSMSRMDQVENHFKSSIDIKNLGTSWTKLKAISERENTQQGTFIVKSSPHAEVYFTNDNKSVGTLEQFTVMTFTAKEKDSYTFIYSQEPIYEERKEWIWDSCLDRSMGYVRYRRYQRQGSITDAQIYANLPKEDTHNALNKRLPDRGEDYLMVFVEPEVVDMSRVLRESIQPTGKKRTLNYNQGYFSYHFDVSEVSFQYIVEYKPITQWISSKSVVVGTGNEFIDRNRVNQIKQNEYWNIEIKEKILESQITTGMFKNMIYASLGELAPLDFSFEDKVAVEKYTVAGSNLTFRDGRLESWDENTK